MNFLTATTLTLSLLMTIPLMARERPPTPKNTEYMNIYCDMRAEHQKNTIVIYEYLNASDDPAAALSNLEQRANVKILTIHFVRIIENSGDFKNLQKSLVKLPFSALNKLAQTAKLN